VASSAIAAEPANDAMVQVTSVSQLSDVQPTTGLSRHYSPLTNNIAIVPAFMPSAIPTTSATTLQSAWVTYEPSLVSSPKRSGIIT